MTDSPEAQLMQSFLADDHVSVARLLETHATIRSHLNRGVFPWGMPPLAAAQSREMVDVLIAHGARVDLVTQWWGPGFGASQVNPETAQYLVELGAGLTIHAAAGIGLLDRVRALLEHDPELAKAKGGDGCHPLHFCADPKIADVLITHGADVNARDDDHDSTPAQWRIDDAAPLVRYLLQHEADADIFLAVGLGDLTLTRDQVMNDPECTAYRIGNNKGPFPGCGYQGRGGSIYQWTLGFNLSPHEVALQRGHAQIYDYLLQHSTAKTQFLVACTTANRALAESLVATHPNIANTLDEEDTALMPKFCWETNKNINAVRLMLDLGFPIDAREDNHGCTALHNAAWCGDIELVQLLLERGHATDVRDPDFDSTAVGWAIHSCLEAKRHPEGQFPEVVEVLLASGTPFDAKHYPVGHEDIDTVLKRHLNRSRR